MMISILLRQMSLQKMEELFHLNLDDAYEREYLLLTMSALSQQDEEKE